MKRIVSSLQKISGLTSSEATVVLMIAALLITGWIGRVLIPQNPTHDVATVQRIIALLDSMESTVKTTPALVPRGAHSENVRASRDSLTSRSSSKSFTLGRAVNVNSASVSQLMKLPGIGPAIAQRIVEARTEAPFQHPDDLMRVKGIGRAKLDRIRPFITAP